MFDAIEPEQDCSEAGLLMLHINLDGYISHIAEVFALLRGIIHKVFL